MSFFTAIFQATQGTYTWVYVGQIACQESLSIATFVIWLGTLVLSIYTDKMFEVMTTEGVFGFFAAVCLISFTSFHFFLKEIKGLTRDECQRLYAPE